jgi:hypothetical protein
MYMKSQCKSRKMDQTEIIVIIVIIIETSTFSTETLLKLMSHEAQGHGSQA